MELCTICKNPFKHDEKKVKLGAKGCVGINMASEKRYDDVIAEMGQVVHVDCRRTYTNPNNIESNNNKGNDFVSPKAKRTLRSLELKFAYDSHCLFCGQPSRCDWKTKRRDVVPVRTEGQFQDSIKRICNERNDDWALTVKSRLEYAQDCFAYDVVYHNTCSVNFRTGKHIPLNFSESGISNKLRRSGRPQDSERSAAFLKVSCYLEDNDDEQISVPELVSLMNDYLKDTGLDGYSIPYMKKRLQEHFNENIIFAEVNGKADVATLKTNADQILHEFYTAPKSLMSGVEKNRVVEAVAKLIKNDIKQMTSSRDTYPSCRYMSSVDANEQFLPDTLSLFLRMLFVGSDIDMKVASIGQATRPRTVIAPLQIGLAVQLHHHFASKFLLDSLNRYGFCSSYTEVKKFELNAAAGQGSDIPPVESDTFMQWVADNVDHNVATLDGRGTFHGMGIIGTMTPGAQTERIVKRRDVDIKDVLSIGRIGIHLYRPDWCKVPPLVYEPLADKGTNDSSDPLELLWKISFPLRPSRPAWAGMMQSFQEGAYPGKSSITLLPMIDLSASDMTCIYSTLKFVCAEARKHDATPIITFDQPLWWKAQLIIANESTDSDIHSVVLRLGTFHTQMSFLGCIGHLMTATGLQDAMETVYAANSVIHMLSGKAISRAIRGHFLIDAALNALLLTDAYDIDCSQTSGASQNSKPENGNEDLNKAADILDRLLNGEDVTATASNSDVLNRIERRLNEHKDIVSNSRTGALWMMYLNMTSILKRSIKAERTGNFQLHLQSVAEMLPYFAASGHNLYAKSARLYLQKMHDLENSHPHVYAKFMTGHHVIRRTDRFWAGLSSDLVIEQVLMRSMKTNGGLTRGRCMAESQRLTWLLSMPACADVNNAMQSFTQVSFNTSEQHKETGESRREQDQKDTRSLILYFLERSPFSSDGTLRNIANGHTAGPTVNVDRAEQVGRSILQKMDGKNIVDFSFKRKEQAVTLANTCILEVDQ